MLSVHWLVSRYRQKRSSFSDGFLFSWLIGFGRFVSVCLREFGGVFIYPVLRGARKLLTLSPSP